MADGRFRVFQNGDIYKIQDGKETRAEIKHSSIYPTVHNRGCFYVHKLMAEAFIPNPDGKTQVNHIDGDKDNYSISNLEWVTASENMKHAYRTGLSRGRLSVRNRDYSNSKSAILRNVSRLCKEHDMTICDLEKAVGIGNGVIAKWERTSPRVDSAQKVARFFCVTVDDLLKDTA